MKTETYDEFTALRVFIAYWLKNRQDAYVHLGVSEDKFSHIALPTIVYALLNGPFAPRELLTDEASCLAYLSRVFAMPPENLRVVYTAYQAIFCCGADCDDGELVALRRSILAEIEDVMHH